MPRRRASKWPLFARRIVIDANDAWTIGRVGAADAAFLDRVWLPRRKPGDRHEWSWVAVRSAAIELFGLRDGRGAWVAIWASRADGISAADRNIAVPYYRLDYLEVSPTRRGDGFTAAAAVAIVASAARHWGAEAVLVLALDVTKGFYCSATLGFREVSLKGWKLSEGLVPLILEGDAYRRLHEKTDENEGDEES